MNLTEQILKYSLTIFDVASAYPISATESCLILGLESTPQRNLDDFSKNNRRLSMNGFAQYVQPGLESIITRLKESGIAAKTIGKYGYTLKGSADFINYKKVAIKNGLGKRGKNTVILNPIFGSRLRFAALKLDTLLETTKDNPDEESSFCKDCSICIDECPVNVLKPYRMIDTTKCLSNIISNVAVVKYKKVFTCDICLKKCPANQIGFKG
ncbi:4Fe-4S double cluster binding domain-containing protein [Chloroflexota bacterium]